MMNALAIQMPSVRESFTIPMMQQRQNALMAQAAAQGVAGPQNAFGPTVASPAAYTAGPRYEAPTGGDQTAYALPEDAFARGIIETAQAIGADPVDLATVISYETGGTLDPMQPGPTTQWGQHRGLIQFGEPQARQYGADFSSPEAAMASQFGPQGAIANYLRASGYQPGMGLLDLYSTINAGAPGLYNRSDANNGGAPGDVRDKVNSMQPHRERAMRLLGLG